MLQKNKEPFTIIPNSIIDELSLEELGVYIMVKKHAGAQGESWVSNKTLEKKFKIGHRKIKVIYASLEKKGLVVCIGERKVGTKGGMQPIKVYKVKGVVTQPHPDTKGWQNNTKGVVVQPMNKIPINKIDISSDERILKYKQIKESLYQKLST